MCISRLCALFGSFVWPCVFYRMHFAWNFHIFAMLSSWFCFKIDPALGSHIAQICKATTACNICRIHVAMMSLDPLNTLNPLNPCPLAGIADFELHAVFRRPELPCRSKIEGRRCFPPQRAFNKMAIDNDSFAIFWKLWLKETINRQLRTKTYGCRADCISIHMQSISTYCDFGRAAR